MGSYLELIQDELGPDWSQRNGYLNPEVPAALLKRNMENRLFQRKWIGAMDLVSTCEMELN